MPRLNFVQAFVILCSLVHSELAADVDNTNSDKSSEKIAASTPPECGLYLVPSAIQGQGRSIVAGKFINKGQAIDHSVTLGLREADCLQTQLMNYVFATNESDIAMTEIGVGMLYNHHPSPAVHHSWDTEVIELASAQKLAHTTFSTVATTASRDIQAGEEITNYYGDHTWFEARGISMSGHESMTPSVRSLEEIKRIGLCMTNVGTKSSKFPFAGKGLYAKRSFKKGEVVTVSPTILIEKDIISSMAESSSSVIQNYCMASHNSKMAFFPFGWGALANHAPKKQTNLVLDWHWWDSNNDYDKNEKMRKMSSSLSDLSTAPYAQLDLAYVADRDINAGEELTYYYGDEWTSAWSTHLARVVEWNIKNKLSQEVREVRRALSAFEVNNYEEEGHVHPNPTVEGVNDNQDVTEIPIPQFRHFIEIPDHLMIPEWRDLTLSQDYIGTNSVPYQDEIGEQKIEINVGVEDVDQGDLWNQKDIYLQNITLKDKMESSLNLDLSLHVDSVGQSSNCVSLDFESCLAQQTV